MPDINILGKIVIFTFATRKQICLKHTHKNNHCLPNNQQLSLSVSVLVVKNLEMEDRWNQLLNLHSLKNKIKEPNFGNTMHPAQDSIPHFRNLTLANWDGYLNLVHGLWKTYYLKKIYKTMKQMVYFVK